MSYIKVIQTNQPPSYIKVGGLTRERITGVESSTIEELRAEIAGKITIEEVNTRADISGATNQRLIVIRYDEENNNARTVLFFTGTELIPFMTSEAL